MPSDLMNVIASAEAMQAQQTYYENAMRSQLQAAQNLLPGQISNNANTLSSATLTVRMPTSPLATPVTDLFFKIPSVAYLVEKIPAAKGVIAKDGVTAAYLNEAKAQGISLRQQCKDLGIPWSARLLAADEVTEETVRVAGILEPTVFAQTKPKGHYAFIWASRIMTLHRDGAVKAVLNWAAWHALEIDPNDLDYLRTLTDIAPSTKAVTVHERSRVWHERFARRAWDNRVWDSGYAHDEKAKLPSSIDGSDIEFAGLIFAPMKTYRDFIREGADMRHCVSSRFSYAKRGDRVYFSIRSGAKRWATAEYEYGVLSGTWSLREIKAVSNAAPASSVKDAANRFQDVISGKVKVADKPPEPANEKPAQPKSFGRRICDALALEFNSKDWTG